MALKCNDFFVGSDDIRLTPSLTCFFGFKVVITDRLSDPYIHHLSFKLPYFMTRVWFFFWDLIMFLNVPCFYVCNEAWWYLSTMSAFSDELQTCTTIWSHCISSFELFWLRTWFSDVSLFGNCVTMCLQSVMQIFPYWYDIRWLSPNNHHLSAEIAKMTHFL